MAYSIPLHIAGKANVVDWIPTLQRALVSASESQTKVMGQGLPLSAAQIRRVGKKGDKKGMSGWIRLRIYN